MTIATLNAYPISALEIFLYFVKVALGGPAFGYLMAKITIFWLSHVFNDALVEITITLASTYITFYIGEGLFEVSGVLAVVTLGIELNSRRTSISPEVETFLHRYMCMYILHKCDHMYEPTLCRIVHYLR